jgi:hypothetical protein
MELRIEGLPGTIANIYAADQAMQKAIIRGQKKSGEGQRDMTRDFAPESEPGTYPGAGSKRLKRSVMVRFSAKGYTYEIYCDRDIFAQEGQPYYPPFVEHGTSDPSYPAQPFLSPAHRASQPFVQKNIKDEVRKALKRRERVVKTQGVVA